VFDIHDGIIQYLTSAMMHFEAARIHQEDMHPKAKDECKKAWELLSRTMQEARSLMSSILPPILDEKGVVAAIEHLVAEHHGYVSTNVTFSHDVQVDTISPLIEVALYRVAQQSLANIFQHSKAMKATIELKQNQGRIRLSISDSGVGFNIGEIDDTKVGIKSMRNRVAALSGVLTITTSENGTQLVADLPTTDELAREHQRRMRAEKEKSIAQERFALALKATSDAIWDCDLLSGQVFWNDGYDRLFGERPADTRNSWQWWIDHIHIDDRERVSTSLRAAANSAPDFGDRWFESYKYQRVDGTFALILDRAFIARDDTGKPIRIIGCMLEVK
jgi:PAS domain-containing protein